MEGAYFIYKNYHYLIAAYGYYQAASGAYKTYKCSKKIYDKCNDVYNLISNISREPVILNETNEGFVLISYLAKKDESLQEEDYTIPTAELLDPYDDLKAFGDPSSA